MMYIRYSRHLTKKDVEEKVSAYEARFGLSLAEFERKVLKGHEEELDARGILEEYEEWRHYVHALSGTLPPIIESLVQPVADSSLDTITQAFTKERLKILGALNEKRFSSIAEFSSRLHRDRSSVATDLALLEKVNLVALVPNGRNRIPVARWEKIAVEF